MRKKYKVMLIVGFALLVITTVKAILFFTIETEFDIDRCFFYAQYDIFTKPSNYDPNDNAGPEYQKAYETFTRMPARLITPYITWPSDFNAADRQTLEGWLKANKNAIESFRNAIKKQYSWSEIYPILNRFPNERPDPPGSILRLTGAIEWNAKLTALDGRLNESFEDILVCWRAGQHRCRTPVFLSEQSFGLLHKQTALVAGFEILSRVKISSADLLSFQNALEKQFLEDKYKPDFEAERFLCYDELQRNFIDNGKGTGRLAFRKAKNFGTLCIAQPNPYLACFIGPTKNEMAKRIEAMFASFEPIKSETPWQLHIKDPNYFDRIETECNRDFFLSFFAPSPSGIFRLYHQTKAQEQALLTTIAVLRFKADKNRLPDALDEVITAGYMKSIPLDPYSNSPLIYKQTNDNFLLYSVGEDFKDDGGSAVISFTSTGSMRGGLSEDKRRDIVFWPVKKFERREKEIESPPDTNEIIEYWKSVKGQKYINDVNFMNEVNLIREISSKS
jgi:hypothetical protein